MIRGLNPPGAFRLRVLATSDIHMHLMAYDYHAGRVDNSVGFVRTATLIRQARQQAQSQNVPAVLLDNGDAWHGTPLADYLRTQSGPHPLLMGMQALGYDAAALGNHDFDFGLEPLDRLRQQAEFPIFSSNVKEMDNPRAPDRLIVQRDVTDASGAVKTLTIGLLALTPPQTVLWNTHHLEGKVTILDIVETGARTAQQLRAEGASIVIALAHTGIAQHPGDPDRENVALALAQVRDIDALIIGHTHLMLPGEHHAGIDGVDAVLGTIHGTPALMPGPAGGHLGVMDLTLGHHGGHWRVIRHTCENRPIFRPKGQGRTKAAVKDDPECAALFRPAHAATQAHMDRPVGQVGQALHTYFATLMPCAALDLIGRAQIAAMDLGQGRPDLATLPLLSAVTPFKCGGRAGPNHYTDVPAGAVHLRHVSDLQVFANRLSLVVVDGATICDWLELSASVFHQIVADRSEPQMLLNTAMPGYNFEVLYGLEYEIDPRFPARFRAGGQLNDPAAHRIQNLRWNGQPVGEDQKFLVATSNYRAYGGGRFLEPDRICDVVHTPLDIADLIAAQVCCPTANTTQIPSPWRFADLNGARVVYQTGPGARAYLQELAAYDPQDMGLSEQGFLQLCLTL
jgi:2',3'-cyclic-nucleotide 2'-phosphodiesterase/3'-nucleotidase